MSKRIRKIRVDARRRGAQTTVEFALILWPFLLTLLATLDYAQFYAYEHSLRYALGVAGRFATPGNVLGTSSVYGGTNCPIRGQYGSPSWISRNESIRRTFSNYFAVTAPSTILKIHSWPGPNNATENNPNIGPGRASDFVRLTATYSMKFITPAATVLMSNGEYRASASGIFLNEPSGSFDIYRDRYTNEPQ